MPSPRLTLLSRDEIKLIHESALKLLEDVGVLVECPEALELLRSAGAEIDGHIAKIPGSLVEECLKKAPRKVLLYDREGRPYAELSGDSVYFNPGSAAIKLLDPGEVKPRTPTLSDLARFALLVEYLENIHLQSTALVPGDVPIELRDRVRLYPILKVSTKPIITGAFTVDGVYDMIRMLELVAGDQSRKPIAVFDVCPSPPLKWSMLTAKNLIDCASRGIPVEIIPMPQISATSPATIAGSIVQHHAEALSGIVLAQLARPGAPVIYGGSPCLFDLRYGTALITSPESLLISTAYVEVAKYFSLPTHTYMGLSDSWLVDYQAGLETMMGALIAALKGINVVSGPGMLERESVQSFEKLVLDNDVCGYALRYARGFSISQDSIALEVFKEVCWKKDFLRHIHTVRYYRKEHFFPQVLIRETRTQWEKRGRLTLLDKAVKKVKEILRKAEPKSLPPDVERELDKYFAEMFKRIGAPVPEVNLIS